MSRRFVLTGGPGAGKTTMLEEIAKKGYAIAGDAARDIIRERLSQGLSPRPAAAEFADETHRRNVTAWKEAESVEITFFERCVCDSVGGLLGSGSVTEAEADTLIARYRYDEPIFVPPPWEEIYTTDRERDHTFEHAVNVFEQTMRWYERLGYRICEVPIGPIEDRVDFVLKNAGCETHE
ncbi:MAG: AAA family ATPase [Pseudomonadota bacterium]